MNRIGRYLVGALAVVAAGAAVLSPAGAAAPKKKTAAPAPQPAGTQMLGRADAWTAYASQDQTGRVCYLVGQPQKTEPGGFARKAPSAMVTHRPTEKIANVVSFVEGYPLKDGSDVALDIGGSQFTLFTKDDSAWARTSDLDKSIVGALEKGRQAVVKGTAQKGGSTTDVYALAGFSKALALIDKACGIQRDDKPRVATTSKKQKHSAR